MNTTFNSRIEIFFTFLYREALLTNLVNINLLLQFIIEVFFSFSCICNNYHFFANSLTHHGAWHEMHEIL